jgi:hypothetical protein
MGILPNGASLSIAETLNYFIFVALLAISKINVIFDQLKK